TCCQHGCWRACRGGGTLTGAADLARSVGAGRAPMPIDNSSTRAQFSNLNLVIGVIILGRIILILSMGEPPDFLKSHFKGEVSTCTPAFAKGNLPGVRDSLCFKFAF